MKKTIVYAVSSGTYSDYSVDAIFSTRERAQAFMHTFPVDGHNDIKEYELDPDYVDRVRSGQSVWRVFMLRDGTTERVERLDMSTYIALNTNEPHIWKRSEAPAYRGKNIPDCLNARVWAKNEKHAIKIVNEYRTRMIAEGRW